ncbi:MAG: hypothetical protein FJX91_05195 [Bacteroidetes bacterium]|nr:hypothetical protein [Bacteroidota bacterium]
MELRNTITKGSLWFAMTTLLLFGISRCHRLASNDKIVHSTLAPNLSDTAAVWMDANYKHKNTYRRHKWPKRFARTPLNISGAMAKFSADKHKPLNPKLALELLLALRQSNNGHKGNWSSADSLRLGRQLEQSVRNGSRVGSRPLAWNRLDSAQWEALPGIGPATARKIIRYQQKLGGFNNPQQLLEIPKFDTLLAQYLAPTFQFHPNEITKLNPNPSWKALYIHPYIGAAMAKILHPFLTQHPNLTHQDWQSMQGIPPESKAKITPYLQFTD